MVIHNNTGSSSAALKPLDPLDTALEALHFGFRGLTVDADLYLGTLGLSRVHHRILYVIARVEYITVGGLAATLGISKQALHRPMALLTSHNYVTMSRNADNHRFKFLTLTTTGREVEEEASQRERNIVAKAFAEVSPQGQKDWYKIMQTLAAQLG